MGLQSLVRTLVAALPGQVVYIIHQRAALCVDWRWRHWCIASDIDAAQQISFHVSEVFPFEAVRVISDHAKTLNSRRVTKSCDNVEQLAFTILTAHWLWVVYAGDMSVRHSPIRNVQGLFHKRRIWVCRTEWPYIKESLNRRALREFDLKIFSSSNGRTECCASNAND